MWGVTGSERIRNIFIRGSPGFRDKADELQERPLRRYGHAARRPRNYIGWKCLAMSIPGANSRTLKEALVGCRDAGHESQWSNHPGSSRPCKVE